MATTSEDLTDATWDLEPLVDGRGEAGVDALLDEALRKADELAQQKGSVSGFDAQQLAAFMTSYGDVKELLDRAASYAHLWFSTNTADPVRGALLQKVQERAVAIGTKLLFFELEWIEVPDERAADLLADPRLSFCAHYLEVERRFRRHRLSEPEETILAEKSVTARAAWVRLFDEQTSVITVDLDGETMSLEEASGRLISPDPDVRAALGAAITSALEPGLRTRAYIFNTLLQDKATDDRLRSYDHWLQGFNLSQEASDDAVKALVSAVRGRFDLPQRWYELKRRRLGLDHLDYHDRMAPIVSEDETRVPWADARSLVQECYSAFSPELGSIVGRFFDERWIDVPPGGGKVPGAFCAPTVPSLHPYVLLNYTGRRRDVMTLAHELGHGVHQFLGSEQGIFHHSTPLTVAETASVFGETLVFERLLAQDDAPDSRLTLLAAKVEDAIATVFRQVAMNGFEELAHNARREEGELSLDRLAELWLQTQRDMLGPAFEVDDRYGSWWSYIPHFIHVPGYVYAYAFGMLLALSVYRRFEERGEDFVPNYLEMLSAGGSRSPEELARIAGCDLTDPAFWDGGLALVERDVVAAEEAATAVAS